MNALLGSAIEMADMSSKTDAFGPQRDHQVGAMLAFCDTILTIIPAALMIAVCLIYIRWYHSMKIVTYTWDVACIKLISIIGLVVLEVLRFKTWFEMQDDKSPFLTSTSSAASLLSSIASVTLGVAMFYDHFYSKRSTAFLSVFLTVSAIAEGLKAKYLPSSGDLNRVATLSAGCMVAKIFLILLLEIPKTLDSSRDKNIKSRSDGGGGLWSRLWTLGAVSHGFQNHLSLNDLSSLGFAVDSESLLNEIESIWDTSDQADSYALFKTCLQAFIWPIFMAWLTCLGPEIIRFISILVKKTVLEYLQNPATFSHTKYQLLGAFGSVHIMAAVSESAFAYSSAGLSLRLRGALTGLLLRKQTRLSLSEAEASDLLTLMTSDIDSILMLIPEMCNVMTAIPELMFGFYVLATIIGRAFVTPFCVIIAISASIGWFTRRQNESAKVWWDQMVLARVAKTANFLSQIHPIKMIGLEPIMMRAIRALDSQEISGIAAVRQHRLLTICAMPLNFLVLPLFAFRTGISSGLWKDGLDFVTPWVVLSLLSFVRIPMWNLLVSWPKLKIILVCLGRIQKFLTIDERSDPRKLRDFSTVSSSAHQADSQSTNVAKQREREMKDRCISFDMVSVFGLATRDRPVLHELDLSLPLASLTMIVGNNRSSKTAFLKTILGEMSLRSGVVQTSSSEIAYCGQKHWLPNDTIENAIIGPAELDNNRYNRVIKACALEIEIRTQGQNQIGPNGSNLSIHQRQKIALARAVYSFCPIVICDDVLALLDEDTATNIFNAVFGKQGVLKEQQRTSVLVISQPVWLSFADQIVHLDDEGAAGIHQGTDSLQHFIARDSYLVNSGTETAQNTEFTVLENALHQAYQAKSKPAKMSDIALLVQCFRSVPSQALACSFFLMILNGCLERSQDLYTWLWLKYSPANTNWISGMTALAIFSIFIYSYGFWLYNMKVIPLVATQTHSTFYDILKTANLPFLSNPDHSTLLNELNRDITSLGEDVPWLAYVAASSIVVFIANFGFILAGIHRAAILIPVIVLCFWLVQRFYVRAFRQIQLLDLEAKSSLFAAIREMTSGLEYIRGFGWQNYFLKRTLNRVDCSQKATHHLMTSQRWLMFVMEALGGVLVTLFLSMTILSTSNVPFPTLACAIHGMDWFAILGRQMVERWTASEISLEYARRIKDFEAETFSENQRYIKRLEQVPNSWPTHGHIQFKNTSVAFKAKPGQPFALERVSTTIDAGQKAVVTGQSGSGKTTLLLSILNLVDITSGKVYVDNVNVSKIPQNVLRTKITSISSQHVELPGTLLDNLLSCSHEEHEAETKIEDEGRELNKNETIQAEAPTELDGHVNLEEAVESEPNFKLEEEVIPAHRSGSEVTDDGNRIAERDFDSIGKVDAKPHVDGQNYQTHVSKESQLAKVQRQRDDTPERNDPMKITSAIVEGVLRDVGLWSVVESRGGVQISFEHMKFNASQKQQVNIARAILHHIRFRSKIILMDEPTRLIEDDTLDMIHETLELAFGHCTRVIVSSESRDIAECDLILTLSNGWLVQTDIVQRMDGELTTAFEKLTNNRRKNSSQSDRSQPEAPEGTTEEGPSQTNKQAAVAFEGETPSGALADARNPLNAPANTTISDGSRDSARDPEDSESTVRLQPGTFSQGKLDHVVSTRAATNEEMSASAPGSSALPSTAAPTVYQGVVRAYKNHYIMDNGEERVNYSLRRVDLRYKHHEHPYPSSVHRQIDMEEVDYWEVGKEKKNEGKQ